MGQLISVKDIMPEPTSLPPGRECPPTVELGRTDLMVSRSKCLSGQYSPARQGDINFGTQTETTWGLQSRVLPRVLHQNVISKPSLEPWGN